MFYTGSALNMMYDRQQEHGTLNRAPPPLPLTGRAELLSSLSAILDDTEEGLSARQPLLIVLDDLHWADPSSLDLLHFVTRHVDDCAVGFLGIVTPELRERRRSKQSR